MRRVDAQELLADPREGVADDVEREQTRRADAAAPSEPRERGGEQQVPDQLVEERRVEGRVLRVAGRAVCWADLESPRQGRGAAEQLLVEIVADAADRLCHKQSGSSRIEKGGNLGATAPQHPEPSQRAGGNAAPDAQAAFPNRKHSPPVPG